jgi:choline kinase
MGQTITENARYQVIMPAAGSSRRMSHMTEDRPKALLELEGKTIIEHSLEILDSRGFRRVTFVVGYMRELFMQTLGSRFNNISIEYVVSQDYATTEHGWSLYLTKNSWKRARNPVVFMDADNIYDPQMLDKVMAAPMENVVLVDSLFKTGAREEELVLGRDGKITGLKRGLAQDHGDYVGGFVGINKFSSAFMGALYAYMDKFFEKNGPKFKYERVFDSLINATDAKLNYIDTGGLAWVNINHEEDYKLAKEIVRKR